MNLTRAVLLSTVYGLKNQLHYEGIPTYSESSISPIVVNVKTKDQAYDELSAPSIIVYPSSQFEEDLQLGGGFWLKTLFVFDIYATRDGELYHLIDATRHYLESTDTVKNYDTGFPSYQVLSGMIREVYSGTVPLIISTMYFSDLRVQYLDRVELIGETRAHRAQVTALVEVTTS